MQIYIHHEGLQLGPYSVEEIRQHLADGSIAVDDLAWHEGALEWVPLAQIEGMACEPEPETEPVPEPAQTKMPSWVPQRRDRAEPERPKFFAEPAARAARPEPVAEDLPPEELTEDDAAPKKRQLTPMEKRRRKEKETGKQLMGFGALAFLCGLGMTTLTLFAAEGQGGGVFVVFIGLLAVGAILFVAGYKKFTGT